MPLQTPRNGDVMDFGDFGPMLSRLSMPTELWILCIRSALLAIVIMIYIYVFLAYFIYDSQSIPEKPNCPMVCQTCDQIWIYIYIYSKAARAA